MWKSLSSHLTTDNLLYDFTAGLLIATSLIDGQVLGLHVAFPLVVKTLLGLSVSFTDLEDDNLEADKNLLRTQDNAGGETYVQPH